MAMENAKTINHNVYEYSNGELKLIRTDNYAFRAINPELIIVERNGVKKNIKVTSDWDYTYKVMKTFVKAHGGADGLAKFLSDPNWEDTACKLIDCLIDKVAPARV